MAKLITIADWLTVNPDEVTCVRRVGFNDARVVFIEMTTGTRHELANTSVARITNILNGEADA